MGCLIGKEKRKPEIIDVQQTIADNAWEMFKVSQGKIARRFLRRHNFKIDVPMNFYHFEQVEQEIVPRKRPANAIDSGGSHTGKSLLEGKKLGHSDLASPQQVGLDTRFNNDTGMKQTYNFSFEKTRKATLNVTYQKGYSIGGTANFTLGLPKILSDGSFGAGINANIQVTKTTGETFEESLTTSATSSISVSPNSHYTANVRMMEQNFHATFKVKVKMSMPALRAPVYIKDKQGNVVFVYSINNLLDLYQDMPDVEKVKDESGKVLPEAVLFTVEGIIDGLQLSSHEINLSSDEPRNSAKQREDSDDDQKLGQDGAS